MQPSASDKLPPCHGENAGLIPAGCASCRDSSTVEQVAVNHLVVGSTPTFGAMTMQYVDSRRHSGVRYHYFKRGGVLLGYYSKPRHELVDGKIVWVESRNGATPDSKPGNARFDP